MAFEQLVYEMDYYGIIMFLSTNEIPYPEGDEDYLSMVAGRCHHPCATAIADVLVAKNVQPLRAVYGGLFDYPECTTEWTDYHEFVSVNRLPLAHGCENLLADLWFQLSEEEAEEEED